MFKVKLKKTIELDFLSQRFYNLQKNIRLDNAKRCKSCGIALHKDKDRWETKGKIPKIRYIINEYDDYLSFEDHIFIQ